MKTHDIKQTTVLNHLHDYIQNGYQIRSDGLKEFLTLDNDKETKLMKEFDLSGTERLKPIFDAMGGTVDYETLYAYRIYYIASVIKD
jgi:ATP-dependent DNA helicase RecQ